MMTRRYWKRGGFGIAVEVPERLARTIGRFRGRSSSRLEPGGLYISPTVPVINLSSRDPETAVDYFRANNPDTQGTIDASRSDSLSTEVQAFGWYHTLELPGGIVTEGIYDHRPLVPYYGLPSRLDGLRAIDVATFDGFWAFELEKRGADVTAVDLSRLSQVDFPAQVRELLLERNLDQEMGHGFALAAEALGSKVKRVWASVYDMAPEELGQFDFVHIADVLLHLERPLDALRAVRSITSDTGEALIVDSYDPTIEDFEGRALTQYLGGWWTITWWLPSLTTLAQMVLDAGFSKVEVHRVYKLAKLGETEGYWRAILKAKP